MAEHSRLAEQTLLDLLALGSTEVSDGQNLGAARDLLESWGRAAAQYRSRHRMPPESRLQILTPAWARDMMRADLIREMPGASNDRLALADQTIASFLSAMHLAPTWYLDSETGEGQVFGAQGVGGINPWPDTVVSYMFHPGAWLFLDGGTLDLGVEIRDATLNATNDVESFAESFESAARVGHESLKIVNNVCVSGQAAALLDITCPTEGS